MVSMEKKSILSSTLRGRKVFITDLAYQADQRQYQATVHPQRKPVDAREEVYQMESAFPETFLRAHAGAITMFPIECHLPHF